eukprot:symbB.v1.2.020652.t1/scaffold1745.1/size103376/5
MVDPLPQFAQRISCEIAVPWFLSSCECALSSVPTLATAFLRQILLAWYGQKVSRKPATKGGDICTMNTAPLSAALTYQSAVIRDRPEQIPSPASTRPLNMLPKEANGMREGASKLLPR